MRPCQGRRCGAPGLLFLSRVDALVESWERVSGLASGTPGRATMTGLSGLAAESMQPFGACAAGAGQIDCGGQIVRRPDGVRLARTLGLSAGLDTAGGGGAVLLSAQAAAALRRGCA